VALSRSAVQEIYDQMSSEGTMTAPIDYNAVLADLEGKRGQIDAAIAVIRTLIGAVATDGSPAPAPEAEQGSSVTRAPQAVVPAAHVAGVDLKSDTFFGLSTAGAVRKFLTMAKRPQSPRVIANALVVGGQIHARDPKTAYANVYSVLKRSKDRDFVQVRDGDWGLAEWYGNKAKESAE
jgi:hypothetical protein